MEHITTNAEAAKDRLMMGLDGFLDRALFGSGPKAGEFPLTTPF